MTATSLKQLTGILSLLLSSLVFAKLDFVSQTAKFGSVIQGQELQHRFYFKNNSGFPVTIQGVHAACGCTIINLQEITAYEPEKDGYIDVMFKTENFAGPVSKVVTVHTSDKLNPNYTLTLEANIEAEFLIDPPVLDFGQIEIGSSPRKIVSIIRRKNEALGKKEPSYNKKIINLAYNFDSEREQLEVSISPSATQGKIKETIYLETSSKILPSIKIPVRGEILGPIQVKPDYIRFGAIGKETSAKAVVYLQSSQDFAIVGDSYEIFVNGSKIDPQKAAIKLANDSLTAAGKEQVLEFSLNNSGISPGSVYGKVFLKTNLATQSALEVNFYGFFLE